MVRPISSYTTLGTAIAAFVGFSEEWFPPGEDHLVWVHTCGWIEIQLETPAVVSVGAAYLPSDVGAMSDYLVFPGTLMIPGIFTAVESCYCQNDWIPRQNCPVAAAIPDDTSNTVDSDKIVQRTVVLQFGSCCQAVVARGVR